MTLIYNRVKKFQECKNQRLYLGAQSGGGGGGVGHRGCAVSCPRFTFGKLEKAVNKESLHYG